MRAMRVFIKAYATRPCDNGKAATGVMLEKSGNLN